MEGWKEAIKRVKYAIEYGLHCNDLTFGEIEDEICFAFDMLAEKNGLEPIDWEADDADDQET